MAQIQVNFLSTCWPLKFRSVQGCGQLGGLCSSGLLRWLPRVCYQGAAVDRALEMQGALSLSPAFRHSWGCWSCQHSPAFPDETTDPVTSVFLPRREMALLHFLRIFHFSSSLILGVSIFHGVICIKSWNCRKTPCFLASHSHQPLNTFCV